MSAVDAELAARVRAWAEADPDRGSSDTLRQRLHDAENGDDAATDDLREAFTGALAFGTAGLRGAMGPGPNRMNRLVVRRAAAGLAAYLLQRARKAGGAEETSEGETSRPPRVVIGFDARHHSATFARDTASIMTGAGVDALLMPDSSPTPVLAFAVRHLGVEAGVMVTASHNPAADNGYKVYLGGADEGSQIVPPADAEIAAALEAVGSVADVAELPVPEHGWSVLDAGIVEAYLAGVASVAGPAPDDGRRAALRLVATTLHGVGAPVLAPALTRAGFTDVSFVAEQVEPDPDFPTVTFPNPEEPGALDLALALARERDAHLLLAVDPDADRCAVAVPERGAGATRGGSGPGSDPGSGPGGGPGSGPTSEHPDEHRGWRVLTGDEVGAVLGEHLAAHADAARRTLAASIVSSQMLAAIAAAHDLPFAATLTGFKWISRAPDLLFGYEEAIGYCVAPGLVRDKDGVTAALLLASLAADLAADGRGLDTVLDDLAASHGVHVTGQVSVRVSDLARIDAAMRTLRSRPPRSLAGADVTTVTDLADGQTWPGVPATDGLLWLTGRSRVVVRPSGTEPKLKCYLEVVGPPGPAADVPHAREGALTELDALRRDVRAALADAGLG